MKISRNVELIEGTMANCYSVHLAGKEILIDSGTKGSGKKILNFYKAKGKKPDVILITHYHPDHIGGLKLIQDAFSSEVYMPDDEIAVGLGKERATTSKKFLPRMISGLMKVQPVSSIMPVSELDIPGIQVVKTPGHTPGSTSYYLESDDTLFVGDAVVVSRSGELNINETFTLDMKKAEKSKNIILKHPATSILSGHGPKYTKSKIQQE